MKKQALIFLSGMAFVAIFSFKAVEEKDRSLAKAQRIQGKYVFLYSEPAGEYDVAFNFSTAWTMSSSSKIDAQVSACIGKAFKQAEKENKEFDGIILGSEDRQTAIKFK